MFPALSMRPLVRLWSRRARGPFARRHRAPVPELWARLLPAGAGRAGPLTVAKSLRLCGAELDPGDFADSCARVDYRGIFEREKDLYRGRSRLAVLGACLMFACDCAPGLIGRERAAELCGPEAGAWRWAALPDAPARTSVLCGRGRWLLFIYAQARSLTALLPLIGSAARCKGSGSRRCDRRRGPRPISPSKRNMRKAPLNRGSSRILLLLGAGRPAMRGRRRPRALPTFLRLSRHGSTVPYVLLCTLPTGVGSLWARENSPATSELPGSANR